LGGCPASAGGCGRRRMVEWVRNRLRDYAEKDGRGYPDWAMRYVPLVRRLPRAGLRDARVLEVGANECGLARFSGARPVVVDVSIENVKAAWGTQDVRAVVADLVALPFRPETFDVVVCADTMEHVAAEERGKAAAAVAEALRSTGTGVVAFPAGDEAAEAERAIREAYAACTGRELRWLEEHARAGLPRVEDMTAAFRDATADTHCVVVRKSATLWVWRWMWRVLMCGWPGRGNVVFQALLRLLTPLLVRCRFGTCYRAEIWLEPRR